MSRFVFAAFILLLNFPNRAAGQAGELVLTDILDIAEVVGDFYNFDRVNLSPDGEYIAWTDSDEGICIYSFPENKTSCTSIPWGDRGYIYSMGGLGRLYLDWSHDSRYLTLAEYPFGGPSYDSDIWMFDTRTRDFVNATDDQITGNYMMNAGADIDYLPMWNPASNEVFFFRTAFSDDVAETRILFDGLALWRVSLASDTPELVYTFESSFDPRVLAASFSPDGTRLALFLVRYEEELNAGIWVLNISDGALNQVATQNDFADTDLGWQQFWLPFGANSLVWLPNQNSLVVGTSSASQPTDAADLPTYVQNFHFVDLITGETSRLVDYSQSDGESSAVLHDRMPRLAVVCDDNLIFYVGRRRHASIYSVALPFDDVGRVILAVSQDYRLADNDSLFAEHNGRAVLDRRLIMFLTCGG